VQLKKNRPTASEPKRKPYTPPSIRSYGRLGLMTQAGTAGQLEGAMMTNLMRQKA
jgi:hypothetical protein